MADRDDSRPDGPSNPYPSDGSLEATGVCQSFKVGKSRLDVLKGVSLHIIPGEKLFLCGPSGAGKTTLLYALAGLERPQSGTVLAGGISIYQSNGNVQAYIRNQFMGYVFQHYHLLPELTALENTALPSLIAGKMNLERAQNLLEKVGLGERISHLPAELSGGEQQRVAIARALINEPQIIFADEPTGNLDSATSEGVMNLLLEIITETRKTLVVVTHDPRLAKQGDRKLTLTDGQIRQD